MAYLELIGEINAGQIVRLDCDSLLIGRNEECDLSVLNSHISRRHAEVIRRGKHWQVRDLSSKNGIAVNDRAVKRKKLSDGDVIGIGPLRLLYHDGPPRKPPGKTMDTDAITRLIVGDYAGLESQRRLRLLLEIATALDAFDTPEVLLGKFGELIVHLFDPTCAVLELGDDRWSLSPPGEDERQIDAVLGEVRTGGEAFLESEPPRDSRGKRGRMGSLGVRSVMAAPILAGRRNVGALYVDRRRPGDPSLTEEDFMLLIGVGRLVSAASHGARLYARLDAENRLLKSADAGPHDLVGDSPGMRELRETIAHRVGPVRSTVLLVGETGTGKSAVARAVHLASPRARGPFVKVNCAAIPKDLMESELFGHERGAFSGATERKMGLFEAAEGGTILLDEVAELDTSAQAKLLAVLQDRQLFRVGSTSAVDVDVRIIAASNRNLELAVESGELRSDLYYRLNVVRLQIPPLRDRTEDIPELARYFLGRACQEVGKRIPGISKPAMAILERHHWPGNVRELYNCMERAVIFADDGQLLEGSHLPVEVTRARPRMFEPGSEVTDERQMILAALEQSGGNRREAARLLGWYPQKLYSRLSRYGIHKEASRGTKSRDS